MTTPIPDVIKTRTGTTITYGCETCHVYRELEHVILLRDNSVQIHAYQCLTCGGLRDKALTDILRE